MRSPCLEGVCIPFWGLLRGYAEHTLLEERMSLVGINLNITTCDAM